MKFSTKKIKQKKSLLRKKRFWGMALVLLLIIVALWQIVFSSGGIARILPSSPLKTDEFGHTNFLLLGVAGEQNEGGFLSDSILVASLDHKKPSISFISLPRDLFVPSSVGDRKINEIFAVARYRNDKNSDKGLEVIKESLSKFIGVPIHYGIVADFEIFEEVVDSLGGIDLFVPSGIVDHKYPGKNYSYQTFIVRKGNRHLNGDMALKYARSRYTTSDYDRAKRQQDILLAIKNKAGELNFFSDFGKLRDFYDIYEEHIVTDLAVTELVALARVAAGIDYQNVISSVLNDDPTQKGGFLYTPAREFYGGQFVLLPKNLKDTKKFIHLVLSEPEVLLENAQISILNGSKIPGKAGTMSARLRRLGFHVIKVGNFPSEKPVFESFHFQSHRKDETTKTQEFLKNFLSLDSEPTSEHTLPTVGDFVDINIVLGTN